MRARKGEWFALTWDIVDFYNPLSFEQFSEAPRFIYAEEDSKQIEGFIINEFDRIRLTSISLSTVFIVKKNGVKLPTHYKVGDFMPGDRPKYDLWISEYHNIIYSSSEKIRQKEELLQKNVFLEHTAKIIRHDMHSGINTYIPRGIKGLIKKLPEEVIKKYNLQGSLQLLQEGIEYTQKVYEGVYAFTSLVKENGVLEIEPCSVSKSLKEFMEGKAYKEQVFIEDFPLIIEINRVLFCTAIDNLIKGGLQFNNNEEKWVKIYLKGDTLCVEDNGVGLSKQDFITYCKPYIRDKTSNENYQGLELNIAVAIIEDHGFGISPELKEKGGTIFRINLDRTKPLLIESIEN